MTDDLVERVARKIADEGCIYWWPEKMDHCNNHTRHMAHTAIRLALEEAARVAENHREPNPFPTRQRAIAAAIRAMVK
jgi:hypothetical protein